MYQKQINREKILKKGGEGADESTEMKYYQDMTVTNTVWNKCDCKILIEEDDDEVKAGENLEIVEEIRKRKRRYRKKRKEWQKVEVVVILDSKKFSYLCLNARKSVLLSPVGSIIAW